MLCASFVYSLAALQANFEDPILEPPTVTGVMTTMVVAMARADMTLMTATAATFTRAATLMTTMAAMARAATSMTTMHCVHL
jgi:hypothetical protein